MDDNKKLLITYSKEPLAIGSLLPYRDGYLEFYGPVSRHTRICEEVASDNSVFPYCYLSECGLFVTMPRERSPKYGKSCRPPEAKCLRLWIPAGGQHVVGVFQDIAGTFVADLCEVFKWNSGRRDSLRRHWKSDAQGNTWKIFGAPKRIYDSGIEPRVLTRGTMKLVANQMPSWVV